MCLPPHELSCAVDCWTPAFEPLGACLMTSCPLQNGACSDELPCVDRVVYTAEWVGGGGVLATCKAACEKRFPATAEQAGFPDALLQCASQACV